MCVCVCTLTPAVDLIDPTSSSVSVYSSGSTVVSTTLSRRHAGGLNTPVLTPPAAVCVCSDRCACQQVLLSVHAEPTPVLQPPPCWRLSVGASEFIGCYEMNRSVLKTFTCTSGHVTLEGHDVQLQPNRDL